MMNRKSKVIIIVVAVLVLASGLVVWRYLKNEPAVDRILSDKSNQKEEGFSLSKKKNIFGLYYFRTKELEALDFDINFVRLVIPWGAIEREKGKFLWQAQPIKWIDRSFEKGVEVIPVIRTVGFNSEEKCSRPPSDLVFSFNDDYGYSKSYYNFISQIAKRYQGKFKIVVIENEVTAENFWCGTMDEYFLLLATAQKAFQDIDPEVKIADSGIPSTVWGFLMTKELLEQNKEKEALEFYQSYFKESFVAKPRSLEELKAIFKKKSVQEDIKKAEYLLEKLPDYTDIINFHYYEPAEFYSRLVAFIREKTKNKPLIINELGTRVELNAPEREKKAAQDMIKKLALSKELGLKAVIWFSFNNYRHHIVGLLDENKEPSTEMIDAFKKFLKSYSPASS